MDSYIVPILTAFTLFIPVAGLITLPFMVVQYRKYGGILILRALVVYGFVLYMMCAYLLTVLPLPDYDKVAQMTGPRIQYIPFSTYAEAFSKAGLSFKEPLTLLGAENWKSLLTSSNLFEILANIIMQVPLGVFMRYYFKKSRRETILIGLAVSLFYELTQLSGLYFIYPRPYRLCSVDDLFDNTLGAYLGYMITPYLCALLPARDELDRLSINKERRLTLTRRLTAAAIDWSIFAMAFAAHVTLNGSDSSKLFDIPLIWVVCMFIVVQYLLKGYTPGKWLLRIRVVDKSTGKAPSLKQLAIRYGALYILLPMLMAAMMFALLLMALVIYSESGAFRFGGIAGAFIILGGAAYYISVVISRHHNFPHSYWSNTEIIITKRARLLK